MSNVQGINVSKYKDKKEKGLIASAKVGNQFLISIKRFSPDTGEELSPQTVPLSLSNLQESRDSLMQQVTDIDDMISDLEGTGAAKSK